MLFIKNHFIYVKDFNGHFLLNAPWDKLLGKQGKYEVLKII